MKGKIEILIYSFRIILNVEHLLLLLQFTGFCPLFNYTELTTFQSGSVHKLNGIDMNVLTLLIIEWLFNLIELCSLLCSKCCMELVKKTILKKTIC